MSYETQFFAKVNDRLMQGICYTSLIVLGTFREGYFTETDIILYRCSRRCPACSSGEYEMIRFLPDHSGTAWNHFKHGSPYHPWGSPWEKTTDWLAQAAMMTLPARYSQFVRVDSYPAKIPPYFNVRM